MSVILFNLAALVTFGLGCLGLFASAALLVGLMLNLAVPHAISKFAPPMAACLWVWRAALWFQSKRSLRLC